jgi:hypothetical protein
LNNLIDFQNLDATSIILLVAIWGLIGSVSYISINSETRKSYLLHLVIHHTNVKISWLIVFAVFYCFLGAFVWIDMLLYRLIKK